MSAELKELQKITRILTLAHADSLKKALEKYASTDERKMMWVLIDGTNMQKDMVNRIGTERIKKSAIYNFLEILEKAKLIENPWGKPPKRLVDVVPASWIELLEEKQREQEENERPRL